MKFRYVPRALPSRLRAHPGWHLEIYHHGYCAEFVFEPMGWTGSDILLHEWGFVQDPYLDYISIRGSPSIIYDRIIETVPHCPQEFWGSFISRDFCESVLDAAFPQPVIHKHQYSSWREAFYQNESFVKRLQIDSPVGPIFL